MIITKGTMIVLNNIGIGDLLWNYMDLNILYAGDVCAWLLSFLPHQLLALDQDLSSSSRAKLSTLLTNNNVLIEARYLSVKSLFSMFHMIKSFRK